MNHGERQPRQGIGQAGELHEKRSDHGDHGDRHSDPATGAGRISFFNAKAQRET